MGLNLRDCHNLIGGSWVTGAAGGTERLSPVDGSALGFCSYPAAAQIEEALAAASRAAPEWGSTPAKERARVLFRFREILLREQEPISRLKALESGKTFEEARAGLLKGVEVLEFALAVQNLDLGGRLEVSRGVFCEYRREPLGVVAGVSPFNFPAMVPLWTIPIALALGNAYVWKPSEKTPLTAFYIAEALREAGLPPGVFSVLHGGAETVAALLDSPLVKALAFVGSTRVARLVYQRGSAQGKRVLALGGAKNHILLLPDAAPELAGPGISDSFTGCAGQRCMAASVLLAVGEVEPHLAAIVKRASSLELGQTMGAIISREQLAFLHAAIAQAVKDGARLLRDGRGAPPPAGKEKGNWLGPTILDHVPEGSAAATEELFGPVLAVIRCRQVSEALRIQASSRYGNACSVFTSSGALAERVARSAKAGMVGVNVGVPVPREPFSFGGTGESRFGHGDITGHQSLDFWSNMKKLTVKWEPQSDSTWMG